MVLRGYGPNITPTITGLLSSTRTVITSKQCAIRRRNHCYSLSVDQQGVSNKVAYRTASHHKEPVALKSEALRQFSGQKLIWLYGSDEALGFEALLVEFGELLVALGGDRFALGVSF